MLALPVSHTQLIWLFRAALVLSVLVISWFAFTSSKVQVASLASDKVNHFVAFFVLAYLLDQSLPRLRFLLIKFWPLFAYGLLIEVVQSRLSYRDFSLLDLAADAAALVAYWLLRKPMRQIVVAR